MFEKIMVGTVLALIGIGIGFLLMIASTPILKMFGLIY
jgi:hypothetical protein